MGGLYPAIIGGLIRAAMAFLAGQGVEIGSAQVNTLIDAALIILSVVGTVINKINTNRAIADATNAKRGF